MAIVETPYLKLLQDILQNGHEKSDRTGTGTRSLFGYQMRFNLQAGFPLLTTKKVAFGLVKSELLWFLRGDTNIRFLLKHNNHIWDEWAFKKWISSAAYQGPNMNNFGQRRLQDATFNQLYLQQKQKFCERILNDDIFAEKFGNLGDVYGAQWRHWKTRDGQVIDQIQNVIDGIKKTPDSRRLIVTAWNPEDVPQSALPPCHTLFQFYVNQGRLSCQLYQRSADAFLGIPFNIASYALLTSLIARETGLVPGEFVHTLGDAHLYLNHLTQAQEQLSRKPQAAPQLWLNPAKKHLADFDVTDIKVIDYHPAAAIKAPVAV